MCCGNRSRPVAEKPNNQGPGSQVVAGSQQPSLVQSQAPVGQVNPLSQNVSNPTNVSSLGRSKLIDKQL